MWANNHSLNSKLLESLPKLNPNYNATSPENCPAIIAYSWKEWLVVYFSSIPSTALPAFLSYILFEKAGIDSRNAFL
jgi:hypothetical protein